MNSRVLTLARFVSLLSASSSSVLHFKQCPQGQRRTYCRNRPLTSSGTVTGLVGGDVARVEGNVGDSGVERDDVADMIPQGVLIMCG